MRTYRMHIMTGALTAVLLVLATGATLAQAFELQWLGHAAYKITTPGGKVILLDPFITKNPKTPQALKDLNKLDKVDLILVTHGHGDHVGDTAAIAKMKGARVGMNADMGHTFASLGWVPYTQLLRFNKGGPVSPLGPEIKITMVRAEHSSEIRHVDPTTKKITMYPGGEPCGYIIELENGFKIYHAGDTGIFADMKFIGEYYRPDLALLPIGGHFTMDPADAAYAVRNLLKTKTVIPMHYGTTKLLKGTPTAFKEALAGSSTRIIVMRPGETRTF